MVKLVFALRRLPHLSRSEFQRIWREEHAPLVGRYREALGLRRYVQLHTLDVPANDVLRASREAPEPYDGVAELWFDDASVLEAPAAPGAVEAALALLEDERRFIDHARSPLWLAAEHPVLGTGP